MTYNPKAARAKRPCPIWWDAFLRDTTHLDGQSVGAYLLILGAMWSRESCDIHDDDKKLATVARVPLRAWKAGVGATIREFMEAEDGMLVSKRLRQEADFVEAFLLKQSGKGSKPKGGGGDGSDPEGLFFGEADEPRQTCGLSPDKSLENNKRPQSADATADLTADEPRRYPTQQPNIREEEEPTTTTSLSTPPARAEVVVVAEPQADDGSFFDRVLAAAGLNPNDIPSRYWMPPAAEVEVASWLKIAPGVLTEEAILRCVVEQRKRFTDKPNGPKAFEGGIRRLAGALTAPTPEPSQSFAAIRAGADLEAKRRRWKRLGSGSPG